MRETLFFRRHEKNVGGGKVNGDAAMRYRPFKAQSSAERPLFNFGGQPYAFRATANSQKYSISNLFCN